MPNKVTVKWIGRERLMTKLRAIAPEAEKRLAAKQLDLAQDLVERIKPRAPVHTGRYRRSLIAARLDSRPSGREGLVGIKQTKDPNATGIFALRGIWRWLEFGTVHMPARPHIFPTYRARKPYIKRSLRGVLRRALNTAMKRGTANFSDAA